MADRLELSDTRRKVLDQIVAAGKRGDEVVVRAGDFAGCRG